ncbi:alpha-hydroxy acid oxidase [Pseudogemmobacter humi]|uniref:L-lactate dehydrogenase [cytochrome] n=1 Tax=Pseudogemmobacter humi TaxID=2483812 RepID=A0A3P5X7P7_9RHOB|nr:alpha-hydroxy acid oxidase [Pseudogemmobacter humi]VDC30680.1 L-lactate dehydrogenase [cytochrome] [Pseudogemmobacter humi]
MEPFHIPPEAVALCDYARISAERLPPMVSAWLDGAAADGVTHAANLEAWSRIRLKGRVLADMRGASTGLTLFGQDLEHPLLLAPVAYHRLAHPEGEHATALGAAATGTVMTVSTLASERIEDIAARAQGDLWFQLYVQARRADTEALVVRAEAAGYRALVVTVDAPVKLRNTEARIGFRLPEGVAAVNTAGMPGPELREIPGRSPAFLGLMDAAPRWEDIAWLRARTRLPLILKGITAPEDAMRAIDLGVDGLVVSNHGGRALDSLPASAAILPAVAAAVQNRIPLICDGGIRRGTDVLKAIALGASAVMLGRPQFHALAVGGARGVAHMITILRAELEVAMALTGCRDLTAISPEILWSSS